MTDQITNFDRIGFVDIGDSPGDSLVFQFTETVIPKPSLTLQIGANASQTLPIELIDTTAISLGIKDISVDTRNNAKSSISKIDIAIQTISSGRSKFGAYQNRLEHAMNNVGNYTENLIASESRIRDADMAKEMMELTKQNILVQASQAMLAQANQISNGVLELLK
ncbi:flagellin [Brevibacillus fulvus]|nr:flagellin [Brevibacillus fulvus]